MQVIAFSSFAHGREETKGQLMRSSSPLQYHASLMLVVLHWISVVADLIPIAILRRQGKDDFFVQGLRIVDLAFPSIILRQEHSVFEI